MYKVRANKNMALALLCCAALVCAMTGCQLFPDTSKTDETGGTDKADQTKDRFIGIYITTTPLHISGSEDRSEGNVGANTKASTDDTAGGSEMNADDLRIDVDDNNVKSGGNIPEENADRIYADEVKETMTDDNGNSEEITSYVFKDIEGFAWYYPMFISSNGDPIENVECDEAISDIHAESEGSPGKEGGKDRIFKTMEGTLYAVPEMPGMTKHTLCLNPVYQSDDGSVYLTTTDAESASMDTSEIAGGGFGVEMVASNAITFDGKSVNVDCTVKMNLETINKTTKVVIVQMDKDNKLLDRTEYTPDKMPETITPKGSADYLVVEIYKEHEGMSREIYSRHTEEASSSGTDCIEIFYPREDGICIPTDTEIKW